MSILAEGYGFVRFVAGLRAFVRDPIGPAAALACVQQRLREREAAFVRMVERAVFANGRSPYRTLFLAAGCELEDVRRLVREDGVEGALRSLLSAGIYVTYDEFKGRSPAVRGSQTFRFSDAEFDNSSAAMHFRSTTGGSSGRPMSLSSNLAHIAQSAPDWALGFAAHDWQDSEVVFWTPIFAGVANRQLMCARIGKPYIRWFTAGHGGTRQDRVTAWFVHGAIRRMAGFPRPEPAPFDQPWIVGKYLARLLESGRKPRVVTTPSAAVRVSLEAHARGVSLAGAAFVLGSEPITPARRRAIRSSGAEAVATYGFSEGGGVGFQCPRPATADDVHVFRDAFGIIQRKRTAPDDKTVDALLLTALRPDCPKILLNTEIGDAGVVETRRCGCLLDEAGYFQHLHTLRSFEKLTGEGTTILGADLYPIMEVALPDRFGGGPTDYQLIEHQTDDGLPRYTLRVNPEIGALDEQALIRALLEALAQRQDRYRLMTALWRQTDIIIVSRQRPVATPRGKILPFRVLGQLHSN